MFELHVNYLQDKKQDLVSNPIWSKLECQCGLQEGVVEPEGEPLAPRFSAAAEQPQWFNALYASKSPSEASASSEGPAFVQQVRYFLASPQNFYLCTPFSGESIYSIQESVSEAEIIDDFKVGDRIPPMGCAIYIPIHFI